jgi:hypothetical protein
MNLGLGNAHSFSEIWSVLRLFLIPIGGGIPAGVLKARDLGFLWQITAFIYFISDVILACVFEPMLLLFITLSKRSVRMTRVGEVFKLSMQKTIARYGTGGPFTLIMISFGVDPMTGRSVAIAAGHGFITGWLLAIAGDMLYFGLLMASTLWLDGILGDGTVTTLIILAGMFIIPALIRRIKGELKA